MYIILYNPLSNNGKGLNNLFKLEEELRKEVIQYEKYNLIEIQNSASEFIQNIKNEDKIIIVGGDGTLNRLVNTISGYDYHHEIYLYKAGTGNDFLRSLKNKKENIARYLKKLPKLEVNKQEYYFLNGAGLGIDGYITYLVNNDKIVNSFRYFKTTIKAFLKFKPISLDIHLDGKDYHFNKVYFIAVMNGKYFGGGMKIAPKAKRLDDKLEVIIVHRINKFLLLLLFPLIYIGWHMMLKRLAIFYRQTSKIEIKTDNPAYLQLDGEVIYPVSSTKISKEIENKEQ